MHESITKNKRRGIIVGWFWIFVGLFQCLVPNTTLNAQVLDWGYRPTKGQVLHYVKNQRMSLPGHSTDLTIDETFEIVITDIDTAGAFLFKIRCASMTKVPDSSGAGTVGSVFHGQTPLTDGTFAEISVTRRGEYVAGRFDQEPAYQKKRKKARSRLGAEATVLESDNLLLRHLASDIFPPLCDSLKCHVGSIWIDSVNHRLLSDPTDITRVKTINDSSVAPLKWFVNSIAFYGDHQCVLVNVRPIGLAPVARDPKTLLIGHQNLYLGLSDGFVQYQEAEVLGITDDGRSWRTSIVYTLIP